MLRGPEAVDRSRSEPPKNLRESRVAVGEPPCMLRASDPPGRRATHSEEAGSSSVSTSAAFAATMLLAKSLLADSLLANLLSPWTVCVAAVFSRFPTSRFPSSWLAVAWRGTPVAWPSATARVLPRSLLLPRLFLPFDDFSKVAMQSHVAKHAAMTPAMAIKVPIRDARDALRSRSVCCAAQLCSARSNSQSRSLLSMGSS